MAISKLTFLVCLISSGVSAAYAADTQWVNSEKSEIMSKANKLKSEINLRYEELRSNGNLKINRQGNEISDIVTKYVKAGMSFDEAESVLTNAGFKVGARPGRAAKGDRPDRYDVYASSENIIPSPSFGMSVEVYVLLQPASPDDYSIIISLRAVINTKAI